MLADLSPADLVIWTAILFLGGAVKGVIGFALPLVSVTLLSLFFPVRLAVVSVLLAVVVTNFQQMFRAGSPAPVFRRLWPVMVGLVVGIGIGARFLAVLDAALLGKVVGVAVLAFTTASFLGVKASVPQRWERPIGAAVGLGSGIIGGLTTFGGPPLVMYLVALGFTAKHFVAAIATLLLVSYIGLFTFLSAYGVLGADELTLSALAVVPTALGVWVGQRLSDRIPAALFNRIVLVALTAVALGLLIK